MDKSSVFNGKDSTYGYGCLAGSGTERLSVRRIEVWGLGSQHNIQDQVDYWKEREEEINKRRKVDKKEFMDGNAELFFGNHFYYNREYVRPSGASGGIDLEKLKEGRGGKEMIFTHLTIVDMHKTRF